MNLHTHKLNNVTYFTESPVNIISATALAEYMKYDEGTWVLTKWKYLIFTCYFGKYKNIISHSENYLPELETHAGFSKFSRFFKRLGSISRYYTLNFDFASICTKEESRTGKRVDFTPEV